MADPLFPLYFTFIMLFLLQERYHKVIIRIDLLQNMGKMLICNSIFNLDKGEGLNCILISKK